MQLPGATGNPYMNPAQSSLYGEVQKMRSSDAELRAEAARIQSRAQQDGQTATTQLSYGRGPDGRSYVTSITITRTETVTINESFGQEEGNNNASAPLAQALSDIAPVRMPFTPSDMAEGFAAQMQEQAQELAEALATGELQNADIGVRTHEGLHFRTAGGLATGLPTLEYMQGPDGQYYAVAGEVRVQTGGTIDSEKASRDAATYARAATAPGDASAQDMSAARGAYALAADTYGKALAGRAMSVAEVNVVA